MVNIVLGILAAIGSSGRANAKEPTGPESTPISQLAVPKPIDRDTWYLNAVMPASMREEWSTSGQEAAGCALNEDNILIFRMNVIKVG